MRDKRVVILFIRKNDGADEVSALKRSLHQRLQANTKIGVGKWGARHRASAKARDLGGQAAGD
jgi:hypothetical protein